MNNNPFNNFNTFNNSFINDVLTEIQNDKTLDEKEKKQAKDELKEHQSQIIDEVRTLLFGGIDYVTVGPEVIKNIKQLNISDDLKPLLIDRIKKIVTAKSGKPFSREYTCPINGISSFQIDIEKIIDKNKKLNADKKELMKEELKYNLQKLETAMKDLLNIDYVKITGDTKDKIKKLKLGKPLTNLLLKRIDLRGTAKAWFNR